MNYQVLSQIFQTLVAYLVLRASFESVGHFYYPYFLGDPTEDYLFSLKTTHELSFYQEHKKELQARGLRLLSALTLNRELRLRADTGKMNIALQDSSKANAEAAITVRMFIGDPGNPNIVKDALHVWDYYLRENPHWLDRDNGRRRVRGNMVIRLLESGKGRNRKLLKVWRWDGVIIDTDPFKRITYSLPSVEGNNDLPVVIIGLGFQGFECQIGFCPARRFHNDGNIRFVFNNAYLSGRHVIRATAHDVHTGKFTSNWSAKFIGRAL